MNGALRLALSALVALAFVAVAGVARPASHNVFVCSTASSTTRYATTRQSTTTAPVECATVYGSK